SKGIFGETDGELKKVTKMCCTTLQSSVWIALSAHRGILVTRTPKGQTVARCQRDSEASNSSSPIT
uniref:Uncharacterized protein n=1 Tax=Cynoglossus semilaevis TaxID=244447 RepID=A0A3P8UUW1_CYNSE